VLLSGAHSAVRLVHPAVAASALEADVQERYHLQTIELCLHALPSDYQQPSVTHTTAHSTLLLYAVGRPGSAAGDAAQLKAECDTHKMRPHTRSVPSVTFKSDCHFNRTKTKIGW